MQPKPTHRANRVHRRILREMEKGASQRGASFHPAWILVYVFLFLIGLGTLLLWLTPTARAGVSFMDALFTATSAATGTGLVVQSTGDYWNPWGQRLILALIQMGGLAALIGSSFFLLLIARRATGAETSLLRASLGVSSARGIAGLIGGIVLYAAVMEALGTWFLASRFGDNANGLWLGLFHTISAFNNAGFEIIGLSSYQKDSPLLMALALLNILGSISFLVVVEIVRARGFRNLSLNSQLVLRATGWLLVLGTLGILWGEFGNPQSLGPLSFPAKLGNAFFHSATSRTAGLSTMNVGAFTAPTLLIITALMFIGGASGSTGGGIKVNTFGLMVAATWSAIRGRRHVELLGRRAHEDQVDRAIAIAFLSALLVFAITFVLTVTEAFPLVSLLFEAVSAFSTTGFSTGITPQLSLPGKLLIILAMFAGRVGPLTLAFALSQRHPPTRYSYAQEAINLG